ncbi:MAG: hypothetical protein K0Q72_3638 [Armatimonadetes bacterium]|jgi:membrane protease YdiL (CAAX protease family)|nr:hypothetical protein [Armatimonadota bacterium]
MAEPSPETAAALRALFVVALGLVLTGDLLILGLWIAGEVRRRPVLAPTWSVAHVFLAFQAVIAAVFCAFCDGGLAAGISGRPLTSAGAPGSTFALLLPAMLKQQVALIGVPLLLVCLRYGGTPGDLGLPAWGRDTRRRLALGTALALLLLPVSDLMETFSSYWLLESGVVPFGPLLRELSEQMSATQMLDELRGQPVAVASMILIIGIIGPIAEEVFFRGFAHQALKRRLGLIPAVILSSLFFALIHGNPIALFPIFVIGVALAVIYERTGSLAAPIALHCTNNLVVVFLYFLAPDFSLWGKLFGR